MMKTRVAIISQGLYTSRATLTSNADVAQLVEQLIRNQ